ncbi:MAG TPA: YceI family protein [Pyrinomonadaceae bacterium]|nr:YceI family protein [Pyrinomonadaceae bacterium]
MNFLVLVDTEDPFIDLAHNRRDFGINYGNAFAGGGLDVGNEVTVSLRLEAVRPAPKPAAGR